VIPYRLKGPLDANWAHWKSRMFSDRPSPSLGTARLKEMEEGRMGIKANFGQAVSVTHDEMIQDQTETVREYGH